MKLLSGKALRGMGGAVLAISSGAVPGALAASVWSSQTSVQAYDMSAYTYAEFWVGSSPYGTKAHYNAYLRNSTGAGYRIYDTLATWTNAGTCFAPNYTSCTAQYYWYAQVDTAHISSTSWYKDYRTTSVNPAADYARGRIEVSIDIPWRIDPTSDQALTQGFKY